MVRPLLRWAGSKRKLVPRISHLWTESHHRYVEPFAGSACFFFALCPSAALISDKNQNLIDTYITLRSYPCDVYEAFSEIPRTRDEYYRVRSKNPNRLDEIRQAARFIYLNRNCFNGIYRTNSDGKFNVPYATSRAGSYPTVAEFESASILLKSAEIRAWDFGTALRYVKHGDFVYLDPPYATAKRRVFKEYGKRSFEVCDLVRLGEHLSKIDRRGAEFVMSYADCTEARSLAKRWNSTRVRVRRNVAGFSGARRHAYELVISNIQQSRLRSI